MLRVFGLQLVSDARLLGQLGKIGVVDIDRQQLETVLTGDIQEMMILGVGMHMGVELPHVLKVGRRINR